jgi:hypothetical protein
MPRLLGKSPQIGPSQRIELLALHLAAIDGDEVALLAAQDWHEEYLGMRDVGIWAPRLEV